MSIENKYKKRNIDVQQHVKSEIENAKKGLSKKRIDNNSIKK